MNNFAPDLSGLVPYFVAFIAVAVVGAIVALVIIGQEVASFVSSHRHARVRAAGRPSGVGIERAPLRVAR